MQREKTSSERGKAVCFSYINCSTNCIGLCGFQTSVNSMDSPFNRYWRESDNIHIPLTNIQTNLMRWWCFQMHSSLLQNRLKICIRQDSCIKGPGRTFTYYVTNQNIFLLSFYCHTKWTLLLKLLEVTCWSVNTHDILICKDNLFFYVVNTDLLYS